MPPRMITAAILLFWIAMTSWLVVREVVPILMAEDAPTVRIDLSEQLSGGALVGWHVWRDGKRIGSGTSRVAVNDDDDTYEFRSSFHYDNFKIGLIQIKNLDSTYRVNKEGHLQGLHARTVVKNEGFEFIAGLKGEVRDGFLEPEIFGIVEQKLDKVPINQQGNIVNPMHLVNRLRGLREGQMWKIPLLDPFRGITERFVAKPAGASPILIAQVRVDTLVWDRRPVVCYKIEYSEPGKEPSARTWARKTDGLVVQQEASHLGHDLVLTRIPH